MQKLHYVVYTLNCWHAIFYLKKKQKQTIIGVLPQVLYDMPYRDIKPNMIITIRTVPVAIHYYYFNACHLLFHIVKLKNIYFGPYFLSQDAVICII